MWYIHCSSICVCVLPRLCMFGHLVTPAEFHLQPHPANAHLSILCLPSHPEWFQSVNKPPSVSPFKNPIQWHSLFAIHNLRAWNTFCSSGICCWSIFQINNLSQGNTELSVFSFVVHSNGEKRHPFKVSCVSCILYIQGWFWKLLQQGCLTVFLHRGDSSLCLTVCKYWPHSQEG